MDKKFLPLAVFLSCAIAGLLYWQLIYLPVQSEILNLKMQTRQMRLMQEEISDLRARHGDLAEFVELAEERLNFAQEYLPAATDEEKFIAELYALADEYQILIYSVQTGEISGEEVKSQSVKIRAEADFVSLLNFIRAVSDGGRLVNPENFTIGGENILNCELEFTIYAAENINVANPKNL